MFVAVAQGLPGGALVHEAEGSGRLALEACGTNRVVHHGVAYIHRALVHCVQVGLTGGYAYPS